MSQIRDCRETDFDQILTLLKQLWPPKELDSTTVRSVYTRALASAAERYVCAVEGGKVVGCCSLTPAESTAELLGLKEQGDGKPSQTHVWERTEGGLSLWFQWHWYDQSHPFSTQPDMNKLKLEMRQGSAVL